MPTFTIRVDDEIENRVKRRLARSGETLSQFVRTAVVKELAANPPRENAYEAWERITRDSVGSGESDRSVTYKERIKEKLRAKHRR